MSIEALKEQARRHEQKEEWLKALEQYKKAIGKLEADDQPDIGLYNRVGDLFVRVGRLDDAVGHYDRAVDLYMESELPNNAIAVCKKIIRNVPARHQAYLRMGQIRAQQGFLPDARTNFLTYAERMQQAGDLDESFRALIEFCDLAPEEVDLRVAVADQMASHQHTDEAVQQLSVAYRTLMQRGDAAQATTLESRIRELDPGADPAGAFAEPGAMIAGSGVDADGDVVAAFGEIEIGVARAEPEPAAAEEIEAPSFDIATPVEEAMEEEAGSQEDEAEAAFELPMMDFGEEPEGEEPATGEEAAFELPMMDFGEEPEAEESATGAEAAFELPAPDSGDEEAAGEAEPLPLIGFDTDEDEAGGAPELDAAAFGEADHGERETRDYAEASEMEELDVGLDEVGAPSAEAREEALEEAAGEEEPTLEGLRERIRERPADVALRQRMVEVAYRSGEEGALVEAYLGLGEALQREGQSARAKAAYQQALQFDPTNEAAKVALGQSPPPAQPVKEVAAHEDYVDLGALILGDEAEKTTRFVVAYEEPSGDEQADFAKMLSQFKEKVSENLDADDVKAHHDLGTAYKEMGLLDEAVSEFQQALRASATHLPTYEVLGQTFMEMGKTEAAIRSLERALELDYDIEDELLGIYYYLARAYETVGNKEQAVEFYDRVFSLDINFADVTERLRALR